VCFCPSSLGRFWEYLRFAAFVSKVRSSRDLEKSTSPQRCERSSCPEDVIYLHRMAEKRVNMKERRTPGRK
jgi:hypothetical protein